LWHQGVLAWDYSIIDREAESDQQATLGGDLSSWRQANGIRKHASRLSLHRVWQGQQDLVEAPPPEEHEYTTRLSSSACHVLALKRIKKRTWPMPFDCMAAILVGLGAA
jgi:hypothetical protein